MSIEDVDKARAHFVETMGNLPPPIESLARSVPEWLVGYTHSRKALYRTPEEGGHLDLKTKELIFTLLDIAADNMDGAKNHGAAAVRAGMTPDELAEGCIQVIICFGIPKYGKTGHEVLEHVTELYRQKKA